jgi:hypothetical protein
MSMVVSDWPVATLGKRPSAASDPNRSDECLQKRGVAGKLGFAGSVGTRCAEGTRDSFYDRTHRIRDGFGNQAEPDLAPAGQLDIKLGEELGVQQRPVLGAMAAVDPLAGA